MPPNKTDEELEEDFAEFFLSKIEKIREKIHQHVSIQAHTTGNSQICVFLSTHRYVSMYSYNEHEEQAL